MHYLSTKMETVMGYIYLYRVVDVFVHANAFSGVWVWGGPTFSKPQSCPILGPVLSGAQVALHTYQGSFGRAFCRSTQKPPLTSLALAVAAVYRQFLT
jgi:hypothetical protein